ncbi:MAG: hypothetical protein QXQ07_06525 [Thermoproteota archaeon]
MRWHSYALVLIYPLYIFKGDLNGYVGFIGYDLIAFGEQFYSASLDSVKNFTFFLLLQTVFNIVCTLIFYYRIVKGDVSKSYAGIIFGGLSATVVGLGILYGCYYIMQAEVKLLMANFSHETSAGKIVFSGTHVLQQPANLILSNYVLFPAIAFSIALFLYAYARHFDEHETRAKASA